MSELQEQQPICADCGAPIDRCWCFEEGSDCGGCYECGGRGWKVVCIDDLCHGQDECIHGDPPVPCHVCNPKGDRFDGYYG